MTSPTALYNTLTGLFGGGPVNEDTYRVAKGKSMIDVRPRRFENR